MNSQFYLGASIGWVVGLFFGRFVIGSFLNVLRGTSMVNWIKEHVDWRGVAVIIMALALGIALAVALQSNIRSDRANARAARAEIHAAATTKALHELVACQRDYLTAQSVATNARADVNAPAQMKLQKFLQSVGPLILNRVAGKLPTTKQLELVRSTYVEYNTAATTLNSTLRHTPLPPSPNDFCKGVG